SLKRHHGYIFHYRTSMIRGRALRHTRDRPIAIVVARTSRYVPTALRGVKLMNLLSRRVALGLSLALVAFGASPVGGATAQNGSANVPIIAAAASLQFALEEIAEGFKSETGQSVRLSFGSSGNFARQIRQGAPYEMFLSADEDYVLDLARSGLTRAEGATYADDRLVIYEIGR